MSLRRVFWMLVVYCLTLLVASSGARSAGVSGIGEESAYSGLYVRIDPSYRAQAPEFENALSKGFVDGAAIMVEWDSIEPEPGVYTFAGLDRWLGKAVVLRKKVSLGLMAGWFTPSWLYRGKYHVPANRFMYNRNPQGAALCTTLTLPSPWNANFIREYNEAIGELSQHLRELAIPGFPPGAAYDAVRIVKVGGINNTTEELRLVSNRGDRGPCHQSDAQAIWAEAGFTPDKVESAWLKLAKNIAARFPGRVLSIDVIQGNGFPAIDNQGRIYRYSGSPADPVTAWIIKKGIAQFPGRFAVQWDALSEAGVDPAVVTAGAEGAIVGWQMNEFLGPKGGSGCMYGTLRAACRSTADFASALEHGIGLGGRFIEIWAANVNRFAAAFRQAHNRLEAASARGAPGGP